MRPFSASRSCGPYSAAADSLRSAWPARQGRRGEGAGRGRRDVGTPTAGFGALAARCCGSTAWASGWPAAAAVRTSSSVGKTTTRIFSPQLVLRAVVLHQLRLGLSAFGLRTGAFPWAVLAFQSSLPPIRELGDVAAHAKGDDTIVDSRGIAARIYPFLAAPAEPGSRACPT